VGHHPKLNNKLDGANYCPLGVEKYFYLKLELNFYQSQKQSICNWQAKIFQSVKD
jgi:hypothetical protein